MSVRSDKVPKGALSMVKLAQLSIKKNIYCGQDPEGAYAMVNVCTGSVLNKGTIYFLS